MRVAIVGTGVAGLVSAHLLHPDHEITVFEADARVGGHANTVDVAVGGGHHAVDTGFIVYNERNYPGFVALLDELGVATQPTDMSFGVSDADSGLEFRASNLNSLFAQRRNLLNPRTCGCSPRSCGSTGPPVHSSRPSRVGEAATGSAPGSATASADETSRSPSSSRRHGFSDDFVRLFLVPFGASIWSADPEQVLGVPGAGLRQIHAQPRLARAARPTAVAHDHRWIAPLPRRSWSHRSWTASASRLRCTRSSLARPTAATVSRDPDRARSRILRSRRSSRRTATRPCACSATRPRPSGRSSVRSGTSATPRRCTPTSGCSRRTTRARRAGTTRSGPATGGATVTYWMNRLQSIESTRPLLLTLNRRDAIDDRSRARRVRVRPSGVRCGRHGSTTAPARDPGPARDLLRRRVLGLRLPRGRRAERASRPSPRSAAEVTANVLAFPVPEPRGRRAPSARLRTDRSRDLPRHRRPPPVRSRRARVSPRSCSSRTWTSTHCRARSTRSRCGRPGTLRRSGTGVRTSSTEARGRSASRCATSSRTELGRRPAGSVMVLAHLRTFGWLFNPLAAYYCWRPDGTGLDALVLEVSNTPWGERHWYVFDASGGATSAPHPQGHARLAVPADGRRLPGDVVGAR